MNEWMVAYEMRERGGEEGGGLLRPTYAYFCERAFPLPSRKKKRDGTDRPTSPLSLPQSLASPHLLPGKKEEGGGGLNFNQHLPARRKVPILSLLSLSLSFAKPFLSVPTLRPCTQRIGKGRGS